MSETSKTALRAAIAATLMAGLFATTAEANPDGVVNIADTLHPNIHQNVTDGGASPSNNANPGVGNDDGDNLHGIAANPGQSDNDPGPGGPGGPGFADQLNNTLHGGIAAKNKVAAGTLP